MDIDGNMALSIIIYYNKMLLKFYTVYILHEFF
jgi:hypothetical protein